jgi:hypothetical protein
LDQAKGYYDLTKSLSDMSNETQQKLDAADFLRDFSEVNHNDPDYENKVASLTAKYPLASYDESVKASLGLRGKARETHVKSMEQGGAYEFQADSSPYKVFEDIFQRTGDVRQARAQAVATQKGETEMQKAYSEGVLTEADIMDDKGQVKGEFHDDRGFLRYDKILNVAAKKRGEIVGKPQKLEDQQAEFDRKIISTYAGKMENLGETDPDAYRLVKASQKRLADYMERSAVTATPAAKTAATPVPAKTYLDRL